MGEFFSSIFTDETNVGSIFLMLLVALVSGLVYSYIVSFRMKSSRKFFITSSLIPAAVGMVICLVNGNIGIGIAIAGAFGLVRFRSAQGSSEEIISILVTSASGLAFGTGYLAYGSLFLVIIAVIYIGLSYAPIFEHKKFGRDRILKVTIPESLDYENELKDTFNHFTSHYEVIQVKTAEMGSLMKLIYVIRMKNPKEEKELIDEIRTKNANLEVLITSMDIGASGIL